MGWTWKEEKRTLNNTMFLQYASLHEISSVPVTCRNNLGWVWDILNNKDTIKGEWAEYSQLPNNWSFCSLRYSRTWNCHCVEILLKAEFLSVFDLASENLFVLERRKIGFQLTVVSVVWRHSSSIQRHCDEIFSQKSNKFDFPFLVSKPIQASNCGREVRDVKVKVGRIWPVQLEHRVCSLSFPEMLILCADLYMGVNSMMFSTSESFWLNVKELL